MTTRKRNIQSVSAFASSPIGAITKLIEKLDVEVEEREFIEWVG